MNGWIDLYIILVVVVGWAGGRVGVGGWRRGVNQHNNGGTCTTWHYKYGQLNNSTTQMMNCSLSLLNWSIYTIKMNSWNFENSYNGFAQKNWSRNMFISYFYHFLERFQISYQSFISRTVEKYICSARCFRTFLIS